MGGKGQAVDPAALPEQNKHEALVQPHMLVVSCATKIAPPGLLFPNKMEIFLCSTSPIFTIPSLYMPMTLMAQMQYSAVRS